MKEIKVYEAFTGYAFNDITECLDTEFLELQYQKKISCYNASFERKIIDLHDLGKNNVDFIFVKEMSDIVVHAVFENIELYEGIPMPSLSSFPASELFILDSAFGGWHRAERVLEEAKYKQTYLEEAISKICK